MALVLPTLTDYPWYQFEIELEKKSFRFEFRWNDRDGAWFFDISLLDGTPLLSGRKVVLGIPLLDQFTNPLFPPGELAAYDTTGKDVAPGIDELGARVRLYYFTAEEVANG